MKWAKKLYLLFIIILFLSFINDAFALDFKKRILPNGLVLIHSENHNLPVVMVSLIIKGGMINEPYDKAGLANIVGETLTEGTIKRNSKQLSEEIDFIGASLSTEVNEDYMSIELSVLKKDIEKGFEILSDVIVNPTFPEEEIKRKKEQIKGYLKRMEEEPSIVGLRICKKEVFGDHPYGRMVAGEIETIDSINRDDIVDFYKKYFRPDNSILSIVGDISIDEVDNILAKYFNRWKSEMADKSDGIENLQEKSYSRVNKKKMIRFNKDITQANIIIGSLGISRDDPDYYAFSVMNYIFGGGGFSSRLMKKIRDEMGLVYDVHSIFTPSKQPGMFMIGLQTRNESVGIALSEINKQIEKIRSEYVTDEELANAKSFLIGNFKRRLDTNRKIADFLSLVEFYKLGDDYIVRYPEYINKVTKEDVLRVAKKYLDQENFITVIVANQNQIKLD